MGSFPLALVLFFATTSLFINPTSAHGQHSPQDYLDAQNTARAEVGAGLLPFSWDPNLEAYAKNYSEKSLKANTCGYLVHSGGPYGENLAAGKPELTGVEAVTRWVAEKAYYNYDTNSCADGEVCGHYTQVVWRDSVRVGCARVHCISGWSYVICSYDPPGNIVGERPY